MALSVVALSGACTSSTSGDEEASVPACDRHVLAELSLVRDLASDAFTTDSGNLDIEVIWREENAGALLGTVDRPVFIIDADAEPDVTTDSNGFKTVNDQRFRDGSVSVAPGNYRLYSPSNVDVTVYQQCL